MKRFYALLSVVAVVAGFLIWRGSRPGSGTALGTDGPPVAVTAADSAFRGYVLGSDSAPIEVVEYADFECPFCAQFTVVQFPEIRQQLIATGRLRWRYRDFPLPNHQWSRLASHAVACADEQGKAWEAMDALFGRHGDWAYRDRNPTGVFRDLMRGVGLDVRRYGDCMDSQRYAGRIELSRLEGVARQVGGTPTFFANGRLLDARRYGNSDAFKALVDSLTAGGR
ncbi:MAG: DsbA family protein [Gemmatimonadales bacterium]